MDIYKSHYGVAISKEQAYEQAMKLLVMLKHIYKPVSKQAYNAVLAEQAVFIRNMLEEHTLHKADSVSG